MYTGHVGCFPYKFAGTLALIPSAEGGHNVSVALWYKQGTFMTNLVSHTNYYVQQLFQARPGILTAMCFNVMGFWNIKQYILMDRPNVSEKPGFSNFALKNEAVCSSETWVTIHKTKWIQVIKYSDSITD
jgi:hypothetical protein